jgi:signal transduction histidine kinase
MGSAPLVDGGSNERSPEEAALLTRLDIFVRMRWLAIVGIVLATVVASRGFNVRFPTVPVYVICGLIALYNLGLLGQLGILARSAPGRLIPRARVLGNVHILLDLVALTSILHFTGGIENPFLFFFVFHIITASVVLPYRSVYSLAAAATLLFALLVGLEYSGVFPHHNLEGFVDPGRYLQASYIFAVMASLATILFSSAYMATAIAGELRKRQREVVGLRDQLIQEQTRELEQSSLEIAKLEEEKARFLRFIGVAAHDLKAPLAAIQSYFLVMLGGYSGDLNEKQKTMLQRSSVRIDELINLISDLLDIPRIETGQLVTEMKDVSMRQIIEDSLADHERLAQEKGLQVHVDLPDSPLIVYGSAPRLQQVITNLMSNAVNYTREGSVTLRATENSEAVEIQVADTGVGIPGQDISRVFEDFFRASNTEVKGTGLGLSVAKRIVEAHGGSIRVESPRRDTGTGSSFCFTVPKKSARSSS